MTHTESPQNTINQESGPSGDSDTPDGESRSASEDRQSGSSTALIVLPQPEETKPESAGWWSWLFGFRRNASVNIREDLSDALAEPHSDAGGFTPEEKLMLNNILRLQDVRVEDLMIPRAEIEAVELSTTLGELLDPV